AVSARRAATGLLVLTLLLANRSLPALKRLRASSGATEEIVGSAAIAQPLKAIAIIKVRLQGFGFIIEEADMVRAQGKRTGFLPCYRMLAGDLAIFVSSVG